MSEQELTPDTPARRAAAMANGCKIIEGRQHRYWCTYYEPEEQRRCPFYVGPDWCVHNTSPRGDFGDWCWSTDAAKDAEGRSDE